MNMIRESTLIDRDQMLSLEPNESDETNPNGPLTIRTHTAIPPILVMLLAPKMTDTVKSFTTIKDSIEYLNQYRDPALLVQDEQAILALVDINDMYRRKSDQIQTIMEGKLQMILKEVFNYLHEKLLEYVLKNNFQIEYENTHINFTAFHLIIDLIEILIVSSKEFATTFHMVGGTKCFLNFFDNRILIDYLTKSFTDHDPFKKERKMNYCRGLASLLNCLFYLKSNRGQAFKELNAIAVIIRFSSALKFHNCELILRSHFVIAGLATRRQIEQLGNIDFTILILEKTIQMFAQASQSKTKYTSYQFDLFYENDMRSFEINTYDSPNTFIVYMLTVTEAFMVNDEIKYRLFNSVKNSLLILMMQGDLIEKYLALNLLINFSFDDVLNEKIRRSSNTMILVDQILSQSQQIIDENLKTSALCLKYMLEIRKLSQTYRKKAKAASGQSGKTPTILLSYHDSNELISMRIRNDLQARGFECELIERKTAQNLDIDKVIKTIEAADCIIALLSTSYEYEKICQFEIVYGYKLGKILLPIAVQNKYKPDYWLEEIFARSRVPECRLPSIKKDLAYVERDLELIAKIVPANREQESEVCCCFECV